jgi:ubiquinone/menaquinone biosynthesis C-methylase UbiE
MSTENLYNRWSSTYDSVENKTRDLEKIAGQQMLAFIDGQHILELGCGTGKNTEWLAKKTKHLLAVDLSEEMMAKAREKIATENVQFIQADITRPWSFVTTRPDLITCSLVLEHIEKLDFVFEQASTALSSKGWLYICELHPYKQYRGSKARFETEEGTKVLDCFVHHVSDYFELAVKNNFTCVSLKEWFDEEDRNLPPRLVSFLFNKTS